MNERERIDVLIARCGSARAFAERIGVGGPTVSKMRSGAFRLAVYAERIATAFPDVNCRWLLTGNGKPFSDEISENEIRSELRDIKNMVALIGERRNG